MNIRSLAGRDTSATRRKPGTRDDLLYENPNKTVSAEARSAAAFEAAFRGQAPAAQAPVAPAPNGYYGGSWNVDDDDADVGDGYWGGFIRSDDVVGGGG